MNPTITIGSKDTGDLQSNLDQHSFLADTFTTGSGLIVSVPVIGVSALVGKHFKHTGLGALAGLGICYVLFQRGKQVLIAANPGA